MTATKKPAVTVGSGVAGPSTQTLEEVIALTRRLRMPYLRKAAADVVPTARAQRWDPAEVLRVLLSEEITGRDEATLRLRRARANFPAGKTFAVWDETRCSIPAPTQQPCAAWNGSTGARTFASAVPPGLVNIAHFSYQLCRTVQTGRV